MSLSQQYLYLPSVHASLLRSVYKYLYLSFIIQFRRKCYISYWVKYSLCMLDRKITVERKLKFISSIWTGNTEWSHRKGHFLTLVEQQWAVELQSHGWLWNDTHEKLTTIAEDRKNPGNISMAVKCYKSLFSLKSKLCTLVELPKSL